MRTKLIFLLIIFSFCAYGEPLKFGIASIVSPEASLNLYTDMNNYLADKLGEEITPIIKRDYDEMNRMIQENDVDFASVCTGAVPYLNKDKVRVLAVPEINGKHSYKSLIITNKKYGIKTIKDLKGRTFAFTDRLSNSGTLYPTYMIIKDFGMSPDRVFKKIFYTKSHDKSIYLVNKGVVQAAAVDSLIFEIIKKEHPEEVQNIAVIHSSPEIISPPFVASSSLSKEKFTALKNALLNMDKNERGRRILKGLNIDRFVPADISDFTPIIKMKAAVEKHNSENNTK